MQAMDGECVHTAPSSKATCLLRLLRLTSDQELHMTTAKLSLLLLGGILTFRLAGQPAGRNAYSVTEVYYGLNGVGQVGPVNLSIYRDGPKVLVENQNTPEQARKYHIRLLFDRRTHVQIFWDVDLPAFCNTAPFKDDDPADGDPFGTDVAVFLRDAKEIGVETIHGMATRIYEDARPGRTVKMWIDPKSGAAMKVESTLDGNTLTNLEVLKLSVGKPPAELFVIPAACARALKAAAGTRVKP